MSVLDALGSGKGFTETEKVLVDYVLKHVDDVTSMTIGELSQHTHCSNSAIVRLCRKLGVDGYREFRIELARDLERRRANMLNINPDKPFIEQSSTAEISSSIAALSKQAIDATYANVSMQTIRKAARLLREARYVPYYAIGDSRASVEMFSTLLYKVGIPCTCGFPKGDISVFGNFLDARDTALVVTYSGNVVREHRRILDTLRARGCKLIVITADESIKEQLLGVECFIKLPTGEDDARRIATFYSQECIRFVLNCIYGEIFAADFRENYEVWQKMRQHGSSSQS